MQNRSGRVAIIKPSNETAVLRSPTSQAPGARWMLALLTMGYGLNLLDRQIINILAEPIKRDLHLADWQLGALSGISFALLYSVAALPIARLADRSDRVRIVGVSILVWSFFTAACGAAGSFVQMLLLRIGVGVGEAGGGPPSQSLLADNYPPERQASALAIFSIGAPVGASIGLIGGGVLAGMIGWRWTMVCAGAPGLLIGALVLLSIRDRHRGAAPTHEIPSLRDALAILISSKAFMLMVLGSAFLSFINYGAMAFAGSFYLRIHLVDLTAIGAQFGLEPLGVIGIGLGLLGASGGTIGALVGGRLGDSIGMRDVRALAIIPAVGAVLCAASFAVMFLLPSGGASLLSFFVAAFFSSVGIGPLTLAFQRLADHRSRATALAVALFINSAIGLSLGPLVIGAVSDAMAPTLGEAEGLRVGVLVGLSFGLLAGLLFWMGSRFIAADVVDEKARS
jgi:MFS family permease